MRDETVERSITRQMVADREKSEKTIAIKMEEEEEKGTRRSWNKNKLFCGHCLAGRDWNRNRRNNNKEE